MGNRVRLMLAIVAVGVAWMPSVVPAFGQSLVGKRAPSFSLPDPNYKRYDILDFRGKWLLVHLLGSGCVNCPQLSTRLEALHQKNPNLAILSIVMPPETPDTIAKYIAGTKITTPVLMDQGQVTVSYLNATPQTRTGFNPPHLFAVNPQGIIVKEWADQAALAAGVPAEIEALMAPKKLK